MTTMSKLGRLYALAEARHPWSLRSKRLSREKVKRTPFQGLQSLLGVIYFEKMPEELAKYIRDLVEEMKHGLVNTPQGSAEFEVGYAEERGRIQRGEVPA